MDEITPQEEVETTSQRSILWSSQKRIFVFQNNQWGTSYYHVRPRTQHDGIGDSSWILHLTQSGAGILEGLFRTRLFRNQDHWVENLTRSNWSV